jgi:hypothetical protein
LIRLGDKVTDALSGLTAVAYSRLEYLTGETTYGLMLPPQDGRPQEIYYVDESRLMAKSVKELQELKGERE